MNDGCHLGLVVCFGSGRKEGRQRRCNGGSGRVGATQIDSAQGVDKRDQMVHAQPKHI